MTDKQFPSVTAATQEFGEDVGVSGKTAIRVVQLRAVCWTAVFQSLGRIQSTATIHFPDGTSIPRSVDMEELPGLKTEPTPPKNPPWSPIHPDEEICRGNEQWFGSERNRS